MKEENIVSHEEPESFRRFVKQKKIRLLPNAFYLRWELELLSAFVLVVVLMGLPDRANFTLDILFPGVENALINYWIAVLSRVLIIGFCIYIFLRLLWLYLISGHSNAATTRRRFIHQVDQAAEMLISICIIFLVTGFFAYLIYLLLSYLQSGVPEKVNSPFKMKF